MSQEEKSRVYSALLFEHDKLTNQINSIKGESLEMNQSQMGQIKTLQMRQRQLVEQMRTLMS
jgi:hypothetical protein